MEIEEQEKIILERLQGTIRKVIDQQIMNNDPKETKYTFDRLLKEGFSEDQVYEMIGRTISLNLYDFLTGNSKFDTEEFTAALAKLPFPFFNEEQKA